MATRHLSAATLCPSLLSALLAPLIAFLLLPSFSLRVSPSSPIAHCHPSMCAILLLAPPKNICLPFYRCSFAWQLWQRQIALLAKLRSGYARPERERAAERQRVGVESGRESAQKGLVIMTPGCPGNSDRGRGAATATAAVAAFAPLLLPLLLRVGVKAEEWESARTQHNCQSKKQKKKTNAGSAAAPAIVYRISHIVYRLRDLLPSSLASSIQFEPFVVLFLVK